MEGRAVSIDRLPPFVQRFFVPMQARVSKPQYRHLWPVVPGAAVTLQAAEALHLSSAGPPASTKPRPGEVAHLILDDNRIPPHPQEGAEDGLGEQALGPRLD